MPAVDTQTNVVSIAAWSAHRMPGGRSSLGLTSGDGGCQQPEARTIEPAETVVSRARRRTLQSQGGRIFPFMSTGTRTVPADPQHAPTAPTSGTAA
jgi:hypothetical protein